MWLIQNAFSSQNLCEFPVKGRIRYKGRMVSESMMCMGSNCHGWNEFFDLAQMRNGFSFQFVSLTHDSNLHRPIQYKLIQVLFINISPRFLSDWSVKRILIYMLYFNVLHT
jgi:hypothetical protein